MNGSEDIKLLEDNGWVMECYSPFELRHEDGSFATGKAADLVLESLKDEDSRRQKCIKEIAETIDKDIDKKYDLGYIGPMSIRELVSMFYKTFENYGLF